jgi:hypothetical protein
VNEKGEEEGERVAGARMEAARRMALTFKR